LIENEELAAILYGAAEFPALSQLPVEAVTQPIPQRVMKLDANPLIPLPQGKPHPGSPGEQQLADRLSRDAELADLFWLNQKVRTVRDRLYWVDLLWLAGKVIVEIDGYHYHGDRDAFREDRNRDYELLISGYIVLRLTHDEVISDIEIAIEKIRDVVRFRRHQQFNQSEV
jgi:very-short-patch-repair endonuclease